jgi:hypothetical protein
VDKQIDSWWQHLMFKLFNQKSGGKNERKIDTL